MGKAGSIWLAIAMLLSASTKAQRDSCAFFGNKPIFPYYHPSPPSNGKDFYATKTAFKQAITANTHFSGIITVIFYINYLGETDFYRFQLCDLNYEPLAVNADNNDLCNQLLAAVKRSGPWKPAHDAEQGVVNARKFYSFKFENGTLLEILPK